MKTLGEIILWLTGITSEETIGVADEAAEAIVKLRDALTPFANIKADDGDTFDTWHDDVVIRCEITVGDLRKARAALKNERVSGSDENIT